MVLKGMLLDEQAVSRAIIRLSHEIIEKNKGTENIALIGILTRGVPLAEKIIKNIEEFENIKIPMGKLDITLYRDDLSMISTEPKFKGSEIDFDVTGKDIILVDDVLYTGRTVRAAIDAIMRMGRPKTIQLCVLIDRGHRELPFRADYIGKNVPTSKTEVIAVSFFETDEKEDVSIYDL
jgi:pyrimidine operon attenuation protein/uracil phosphoribosyltransferase